MKKILMTTIAAGALALTSCENYLDINKDPNSPAVENVTSSMIMPAAEMNLAASYGDYMRITGGYFAQHYAQEFGTSNYIDYSAFYMSATRSSSTYTQMMIRVISSAQTIIDKTKKSEPGTCLAATTIKAFAYEALVDCYGELPYTEALDPSNTSPKFDDGETIYRGILKEINAALADAKKSNSVCTNFLYPGENAEPWIRFANSLKLRILTRCINQCPDLQTELDNLIKDDTFAKSDVQFAGCWANEPGKMSPFYAEEFSSAWGSTQINVVPNIAILGTMLGGSIEDPRVDAFWTKGSNGKYNGYISSNTQIVQGTTDADGTTCDANYFSRPKASYDMPVVLISLSDIEFYIAEYYAKQNNPDEAKNHYVKAIEASFAASDVEGADAYVAAYPYDQANWKKVIGVAKWVANAGFNGFEAWCEMRRLDYPAFDTSVSGEDFDDGVSKSFDPSAYEPGTIYTPRNVRSEIGPNKLLERWPYAEASTTRNSNAPAFPGHTVPVFWAK